MDEIPQVQNAQNAQAENTQPVIQAPIDQPPIEESPKGTGIIRKIFNASSWFVFFAFLPVTVLILLSQNSVPGDMFYPIKRSMENVVLAAATVSPSTRAAFRTDLTTRRFDEAEKLLLGSSDTNGLKEFITEIQAAQDEVSAISNPVKKQELQEKIQTSIIEYEKRLGLVKTQLVTREQVTQLAFAPTVTPTLPIPTNTPVPVPTSIAGQLPIPTNTPVPLPTSTPKPIATSISRTAKPTKEPTIFPTPTPMSPTNVPTRTPTSTLGETPTSTPVPSFTPTPTPVPEQTGGGETIETVDKVHKYLHCLKNTPPPHSECIPPEFNSKSSNSRAGESERTNEEKSKRDEERRERKEQKENRKEKENNQSHEGKNTDIDN